MLVHRDRSGKISCRMATIATATKLAKVHIVTSVTAETSCCRLGNTLALGADVTRAAIKWFVSAIQRVAGGHRMVELPDTPIVRRMAARAVCAEAARVIVILFVA